MKTFITENFLLKNKTAERLFHEYAKDMPIIDYHCHLSPKEIAEDKHYRSITEMWLDGDHYKWRAIRSAGFTEQQVTGHIGNPKYDKQRFDDWASVLPQAIGNPLYHWTNLELLRYFDVQELLTPQTSDTIYDKVNQIIASPDFSARNLIKKFNVVFIGTTDDPIDTLEYHKQILDSGFNDCKVTPSWRPDKIVKIELSTFNSYIDQLAQVCNIQITTLKDLEKAISMRIDYFASCGCSISDHGLDEFVFTRKFTENSVATIFAKARKGDELSREEIVQYKSYVLVKMGEQYSQKQWVMQLHMGAVRNNNTKWFNTIGPDAGADSINDHNYAPELSAFLDTLNTNNSLPKTILYSLNPRDNEMLASMIGNFQGDIPGKLQHGSGWWFNDQKDGMERQMIALASLGLLPRFVGMLTDSRSFLSFSRHEYFRRILCNIIGAWAEEGEVPNDIEYLGQIVKDISFNNAKQYFRV